MDCLTSLEHLDSLESDYHPLLEPQAQAQSYSHTTVRRAFIVWLRCGQKNHFKDVCDYYHRLEALEDQMSSNMRAASRQHEFSLFTRHPPTSAYLQTNFPHLYSSPHVEHQGYPHAYVQNYHMVVEHKHSGVIIEEIKEETDDVKDKKVKTKKTAVAAKAAPSDKEIFESSQAFRSDCKHEGVKRKNRIGLAFAKLNTDDDVKLSDVVKTEDKEKNKDDRNEPSGTSKKDIVETSHLIKNFCTDQQVPLNNFLENFKEHASRCELTNTVINVGFYIKRKMVQAELGLAVKVHRAKVYNNGHKDSPFKTTSPANVVTPTTQCDTLNVDNEALVNGFAKLSMQISKVNKNDESKGEISTAKVFGVKDRNVDKKVAIIKREDINSTKNNTGFSNTHLTKIDTVKCRKI